MAPKDHDDSDHALVPVRVQLLLCWLRSSLKAPAADLLDQLCGASCSLMVTMLLTCIPPDLPETDMQSDFSIQL